MFRSGFRLRRSARPLQEPDSATLRFVLAVSFDLEAANEQRRKDVFGLIVGPYADAIATRRNVRVIMGWDVVLTPFSRVHHERLEWLSDQPIPNILRHDFNLSKKQQRCNTLTATPERR
jgi:hypothetical protein